MPLTAGPSSVERPGGASQLGNIVSKDEMPR